MANQIIHQSRKGITLIDGYYLAKNPRTNIVSVISISNGLVCIHEITKQMNLNNLVHLDSIGFLDIYSQLQQTESSKIKKKFKKDENDNS